MQNPNLLFDKSLVRDLQKKKLNSQQIFIFPFIATTPYEIYEFGAKIS